MPAPLVPAVELDGLVLELDGLVLELDAVLEGLEVELVLEDPAELREPAPIAAFARMKLSALDAPPALALPLVPVADAPVPDCRQPVTVTDWLERLLDPACDPGCCCPTAPTVRRRPPPARRG